MPVDAKGRVSFDVIVRRGGEELDRVTLELEVKNPDENRRVTFVSQIDDSVQYFGLLPARGEPGPKALVLSLHGAAVEAIKPTASERLRTELAKHLLQPTTPVPRQTMLRTWLEEAKPENLGAQMLLYGHDATPALFERFMPFDGAPLIPEHHHHRHGDQDDADQDAFGGSANAAEP